MSSSFTIKMWRRGYRSIPALPAACSPLSALLREAKATRNQGFSRGLLTNCYYTDILLVDVLGYTDGLHGRLKQMEVIPLFSFAFQTVYYAVYNDF